MNNDHLPKHKFSTNNLTPVEQHQITQKNNNEPSQNEEDYSSSDDTEEFEKA